METCRIYLSGGMSGLSFEEQSKWRKQFCEAIKYGEYDCKKTPYFFDPTKYYNFEENLHKTEHEIMDFDLNALRKSDLIVVNFNAPNSIGTAMELMLGKELNIPIIGLNKDKKNIHPWLECSCNRMCDDMRELVTHVVDFYLN